MELPILEKQIGRGRDSVVWASGDIAVKLFRKKAHYVWCREVATCQRLYGCEGVIAPIVSVMTADTCWISYPRLYPLTHLLRRLNRADKPGLGITMTRRLTRDLARGIAAMHARGVVHGDIKPSNILLKGDCETITDFEGANFSAVIADLGSCVIDGAKNKNIATPGFAAPEIVHEGGITAACDPWALMCTSYQIATGSVLFDMDGEYGTTYDDEFTAVVGGDDEECSCDECSCDEDECSCDDSSCDDKDSDESFEGSSDDSDSVETASDDEADALEIKQYLWLVTKIIGISGGAEDADVPTPLPLEQVITLNYEMPEEDASKFADFLRIGLAWTERATIAEILAHPWLA